MAKIITLRTPLAADDEAQELSPANPDRVRFWISNNSADKVAYVGFGEEAEATAEFTQIGPGRTLEDRPTERAGCTQDSISVVCAMGETADVVLLEWIKA